MPAAGLPVRQQELTEHVGINLVSAVGLPEAFWVKVSLRFSSPTGTLLRTIPAPTVLTIQQQQHTSSCTIEDVPLAKNAHLVVRFKLYKQGLFSKKRIGTASAILNRGGLAGSSTGSLQVPVELPVTPSSRRTNTPPPGTPRPSIRVVIVRITDFTSLEALNPPPRAHAYPSVRRLYFRVPDCDAVLGAIDYHTTTADVSLYVTQPSASLHLDLAHPAFTTHVTRTEAPAGLPCLSGQDACLGRPQHYYEHVQLCGVPLDAATLSRLQLIICEKACEMAQTLDVVIRGHNWTGDLGWDDAIRLTNVQLDRPARKVYMDVGHGAFLVLNYSRCSFELTVTTEATADTAFDLVTHLRVDKVGQVVQGPQLELGQYQVQRRLEVRGAPADTCFVDVELCRYRLAPVLRKGQFHVELGSLVALQ